MLPMLRSRVQQLLMLLVPLALAMSAWCAHAQNFVAVPPLKTHVTDLANMLSNEQQTMLENVLQEYETRTGNQIAVLLIQSTAPEAIEQYSIRVADAWKLGRKGVDDGVLLLVAKDNPAALRRLRIESGRGVQGVLTDAQSKRILQDVIAPHFRQGDFYGGLAAGVSAITGVLDKETFPQPEQRAAGDNGNDVFSWLPFIFFAILILITWARSRGGRGPRMRHSNDGWGNSSGVILGGILGNEIGRRSGGHFDGGGFGSSSGGFGGGGGFSGGGGGFDGGGASGNW